MKIRGYFWAALVIILAVLLFHRVRDARVQPATPQPESSRIQTTGQVVGATRRQTPSPASEAAAASGAGEATNVIGSRIAVGDRKPEQLRIGDSAPSEAQADNAAPKPSSSLSTASNSPPLTHASPPPIELGRTNLPEIPPGQGRKVSGP